MEHRTLLSVVTSSADSGAGTLRQALASAVPGETITFGSNLTGATIYLTSGELAVTKPVTILGPTSGQLTIDAQFHSRVFDITAQGGVTIDNLTIAHGRSAIGGGVYAESGTLTLQGDILAFDQAIQTNAGDSAMGGAVALGMAAKGLKASNDLFYGNLAWAADGQAGAFGGQTGGDGAGGAIYTGPGTILLASSDVFYDSQVYGGAGGKGFGGPGGTSTPGGPGGNAVGGAIAAYGTTVIRNDNFQLSSAHGGAGGAGGNGIQGGAGGAGGAASGGAVYADGGLDIVNVLFQGSIAAGGAGGAGGGYGTSPIVPGSTAAAGGAGGSADGGAVDADGPRLEGGPGTPVLIQSVGFWDNAARAGAGGAGGEADICGAGGPGGQAAGGGLMTRFAALSETGSWFYANEADGGAGGAGGSGLISSGILGAPSGAGGAGDGGGEFAIYGSADIENGWFSTNTARGGQAGVAGLSSLAFQGVDGSAGGSATGGGLMSDTTLKLVSMAIVSNTAVAGDGGAGGNVDLPSAVGGQGGDGGDASGGGLEVGSGGAAVSQSYIGGNKARGGQGGTGGDGEYNGATGGHGGQASGGGIDARANLSLNTVLIGQNTAHGGQGGDGGDSEVVYGDGGDGGAALGGGLSVDDGTTTLVVATVTSNTAIGGLGGNSGNPGLPTTQLGNGGSGGDANGGGIEVGAAAVLAATSGTVSQNEADGGAVGNGIFGANVHVGQGIGGGVDLAGPGSTDTLQFVISGNQASTADNDLHGSFL